VNATVASYLTAIPVAVYLIVGHHHGMGLFTWAGRRLPRHFGPPHVAAVERLFARWGVLAVFFGRFVALLRIFAGPLAGALRMPYRGFLPAIVVRRRAARLVQEDDIA
jgi:membrane protein DedA with SNARE-associated domain